MLRALLAAAAAFAACATAQPSAPAAVPLVASAMLSQVRSSAFAHAREAGGPLTLSPYLYQQTGNGDSVVV